MSGKTAAMIAASNGNTEILKALGRGPSLLNLKDCRRGHRRDDRRGAPPRNRPRLREFPPTTSNSTCVTIDRPATSDAPARQSARRPRVSVAPDPSPLSQIPRSPNPRTKS